MTRISCVTLSVSEAVFKSLIGNRVGIQYRQILAFGEQTGLKPVPTETMAAIIHHSMYKLVILIEPQEDSAEFDRKWPALLAEFERMPELRREVTSRVDRVLVGNFPTHMIHELFFDSLKAATDAMASAQGLRAGQLLQELSGGKVTLLLADHLQDDLSHIERHREQQKAPPTDRA